MKQKASAMLSPKAQAAPVNLDTDLGAPIDDVVPVAEEGEETVTIEIPAEVAKDLSSQVETQVAEKEGDQAPEELTPEASPMAAHAAPAMLASSGSKVKTAAKPTKVEDISSGVEGKVSGGAGTIGNEGPSNIDVAAKKPTIPSNESASKIRGEKETIPEATLPDIASDHQKLAPDEQEPEGKVDIRGRVIAGTKVVTKEAKKPTVVEDISSGVEGKVKGGTGTIGNEGPSNIDVAAKKPSIPEGGAGAKIDGEKETIPEAGLPDIPSDHQKLAPGEQEPEGKVDIRGRVIADTKRQDQLSKITAARHKKACQVAAKLLGSGRIAETDFDGVVEGLSKIEIDKIDHFADMMYRSMKVAGVVAAHTQVLSTPIVQEASSYQPEMPKGQFEGLKGIFTIGNEHVHQKALDDDRKQE